MDALLCPKCAYDLRPQFEVEPVVCCPECGLTIQAADCVLQPVFSWRVVVGAACVPLVVLIAFRIYAFTQGIHEFSSHALILVPIVLSLCASVISSLIAGGLAGSRAWRVYRRRVAMGRLVGLVVMNAAGTTIASAFAGVVVIQVLGALIFKV